MLMRGKLVESYICRCGQVAQVFRSAGLRKTLSQHTIEQFGNRTANLSGHSDAIAVFNKHCGFLGRHSFKHS